MAKPIEGIPPFRGKAAKWLDEHMKSTRVDEHRQQQAARRDGDLAKRVKPLPRS